MKVLALVLDAFGGHGGVALYNRNLLRALCDHPSRPEVVVVPLNVPLPVEELPENLDYRLGGEGSKVRYVAEAMKALIDHRGFDLILVSIMNLMPVAAAVRALNPRARVLLMAYGVDAWTPRSFLSEPLVRMVDAVVAIRQHTADRMISWAPLPASRVHILENAIRLEEYGVSPKRHDLVEKYGLGGKRVLLTLSRLDDRDFGIDEVLEVLPDLVQEISNLTYLVVGDGRERARMLDKARNLGVADRVVFTGFVDQADKADHFRLGDAFVMAGRARGHFDRYPLRFVFLEAMACGLPVVAAQPDELGPADESPIPNIYVEPNDAKDLKRGVLEALERGVQDVPPELQRYDYPNFSRRFHAIVDELMNGALRSAS